MPHLISQIQIKFYNINNICDDVWYFTSFLNIIYQYINIVNKTAEIYANILELKNDEYYFIH